MNLRQLFLQHVAQTSQAPLAIEIVHAEGCTLKDAAGRQYIDLIGGISVAHVGHRHPQVVSAIKAQLDRYLHVMVYGEFVQSPQVEYATMLTQHLPPSLNSVYFTNSGAEAVEGAMKLAERVTGRTGIVAFDQSYHGSTQGALSIIGDEYWRNAFRPLLPGITHMPYNDDTALAAIDADTACVILETVQAEAGVRAPRREWIQALAQRCRNAGALLVLDEIQTGFGRTGHLWAFRQYGIEPDILLLGKALGGGMPLGAFIAGKQHMDLLTDAPVLGHITTFGGHPVCCAAGKAGLEVVLQEQLAESVAAKAALFQALLVHPAIKEIRQCGLWLALDLGTPEYCREAIGRCIDMGVISDWFLFAPHCLRISPPLTITEEEIRRSCAIILEALK